LNRAACNLELQNYSSVLRDCAAIIAANTRAPAKAHYCMGLPLKPPDEALDARPPAWEAVVDVHSMLAALGRNRTLLLHITGIQEALNRSSILALSHRPCPGDIFLNVVESGMYAV